MFGAERYRAAEGMFDAKMAFTVLRHRPQSLSS